MIRSHKIALLAAAVVAVCAGIVFGVLPRSDDRPGIAGFVYPEPKTISPFKLAEHDGSSFDLEALRGKWSFVYFGYTHCPDVCPTTLADLASAVRKLGPEGDRVQVLFVTVDPKRDTRELLARYVPAFDPRFLGLRGDVEATARVTKEFRVYAAEREGKTPESYTVEHSAQTFAFDPQGRLRLVIAYGAPRDDIAADLRLLLNS